MSTRFDLVVVNGTVVTAAGRRNVDIGIVGGRFARLAPRGQLAGDAAERIDAAEMFVLPGVIDGHVHFREPGLEHEEDWSSGSRAGVHGGVTTVLDMPNTLPPTADVAAARDKIAVAEAGSHCDFGLFGLLGDDPHAVRRLAESGLVVGLKAFLGPTTGELPSPTDDDLHAGLDAARDAGLRVAFHAEDGDIVARSTDVLRAAGRHDPLAHLEARPVEAELAAIDRVGRLLLESGAAGHIAHVTSTEGLAAIERWRQRRVDLSCEVTPHHALLDRDVYPRFGGRAKVNPPIRGEPDASVLLAALADGRIDCLASDHAPHLAIEKDRYDVWAVPAGFAGTETMLPLLLTEVAAGRLTFERLVRASSLAPARAWRLWPRKGAVQIGSDADLAIVDPQRAGVIRAADLHAKNSHSPWEGRRTVGAVVTTIVRGRIAMRDGQRLVEPGWGRRVRRF